MKTRIINIKDLIKVPEFKTLYSEQPIDDLVNSYQNDGQLTPVHVNSKNEIVNGYRMVAAIQKAGGTTVLALILDGEPTIYDRMILNQSRIKTTEDRVKETRLVFARFPKQQGKKNPNKEKYRRDEIIEKYLNNRYRGDKQIQKLEFILNNDVEGDTISKGVIDNNWKVDTCYQFLKEFKEIDEKKEWGFTQKLQSGSLSITDTVKLISQKIGLDNYKDTFVIPTKVASYHKNCLDISKMEELLNLVDLLLTSPPYFTLRKYENGDPNQIGHEKTKEEYCEHVSQIIGSLIPTLKQTANVIVNIGETYDDGVGYGIPQLLKTYLEKNTTLIYKDTIVWSKTNSKPQNENIKRPQNKVEYLLWFVVNPKLAKYNLLKYTVEGKVSELTHGCKDQDKNGKIWDKNLSLTKPYKKIFNLIKEQEVANIIESSVGKCHEVYKVYEEAHPAIMSPLLPIIPILMTTDEDAVVLDPFAGSNIVGMVSLLLNRRVVSTELSKHYFNIGCKLLENTIPQFDRDSMNIINDTVYMQNQNDDQRFAIAA